MAAHRRLLLVAASTRSWARPAAGGCSAISAPVVVNDRAYVGGSYVDLPPTSPYDVWFADVGASFDTATGAVVGGGSGAGTAATTNALYFQTKIAVSSYIPRFAVYDVLTVETLDGSTNRFLTAGGGGAPAVGDGRVVRTVGTSLEVYDAAGVEFCGNDPIFPVVGYACEPLWRGELPAGVALDARPTVAHGHAFVPLLHGSVVAFRTAACGAATCAPE